MMCASTARLVCIWLAFSFAAMPLDVRQVSDLPGQVPLDKWAAPKWAGEARKEIGGLAVGKAQPFHTSGGPAANTLNTYTNGSVPKGLC
jgi:hypothetical protein